MTELKGTHFSSFAGKLETRTSSEGFPVDPEDREMFYNSDTDTLHIYDSGDDAWYGALFSTTTSTSSSTTTTSTSTTTTSTSTTTSTTTSTSTSTSTTTTV